MKVLDPERRRLAERIARRADRARIGIDPVLRHALTAYVDLLMRWNRRINLTALTDDDQGIDRLIVEPLAAARQLPKPDAAVTDIGSGGGSPAVPMKLAAPAARLRMVESRTRKAAFLREVVRQLGLDGTIVEAGRLEELAARRELLGKADVVTVRGVRVGACLLRQIQPLVSPGGVVFLFRNTGGDLDPGLPSPWRVEAAHPLLGGTQHLMVLKHGRR